MLKPKAALVRDKFKEPNGKIWTEGDQNKKGRLSGAGIQRCKELAASGIAIEGYTVTNSPNAAPVVTKIKADSSGVVDIRPQMRGNDLIPMVEGKPWAMGINGCCNLCGQSLTYCPCPNPVVNVDFDRTGVVVFKPTVVSRKA